jgi:hypothetical protein
MDFDVKRYLGCYKISSSKKNRHEFTKYISRSNFIILLGTKSNNQQPKTIN